MIAFTVVDVFTPGRVVKFHPSATPGHCYLDYYFDRSSYFKIIASDSRVRILHRDTLSPSIYILGILDHNTWLFTIVDKQTPGRRWRACLDEMKTKMLLLAKEN